MTSDGLRATSMTDAEREAYEDRMILRRLGFEPGWRPFATIHVVRPEGMRAVERLKRRGLVDYHVQDGIWYVSRSLRTPPRGGATPPRPWPLGGGGSAA